MKKIFMVLATVLAAQSVWAQVYFGQVRVHSVNTEYTTITNNSSGNLRLNNVFSTGIYFDARHSCYGTIHPYESCTVQVQFWPQNVGYYSTTIYLNFTDDFTHQSFTHFLNASGNAVP